MNLKYKSIIFAVITAFILYFNYPTLVTLFFDNKEVNLKMIKDKYASVSKTIDEIKKINLAIVDLDKKRIRLLKNADESQSLTANDDIFKLPALKDILSNNFQVITEGSVLYLTLKPEANEDVFLSDVAGKLNRLFENTKSIDRLVLREHIPDIQFLMKEGRRISDTSEPILSMLGDNFDWIYSGTTQSYSLFVKEYDYSLNLGLDLKGGIYLDLGVDTDKVIQDQLNSKVEAIKTVLTSNNVDYNEIKRGADNIIEIHLTDKNAVDFGSDDYTFLIDGYTLDDTDYGYQLDIDGIEIDRIKKLTIEQALNTIRNRTDELGVKEPSISKKGNDSIIVQLPGVEDPDRAVNIIKKSAVLEFRLVQDAADSDSNDNSIELIQEFRDPVTREITQIETVVLENNILLKGEAVSDARVAYDQFNVPYVSLTFKNDFAPVFGEITANNRGRLMAIILDDVVQSSPRINEAIYGGQAQISGNFSVEEASDLALVLRSGSLPAPLIIKEQKAVGASLGEDSIRQSLIALSAGFLLLIIFMIFWYRLSGMFAVITLLFNLMLMVSFLAYFGATITLPGIAGVVLTIGMAVDANVLIFERIREEISSGETINRKIIGLSFKKAFSTIMDSNLTTLFSALILFEFGTGPIKGFAVTLSVGIFTSVFSAMLFTRLLLELAYQRQSANAKISV